MDGVFAGWTASDLLGPPLEVVQLVQAIYGPTAGLLPPDLQKFMAPMENESFCEWAW